MSDSNEGRLTAIVVFTDGGHTLTEDIRRRTPDEIGEVDKLFRDVVAGECGGTDGFAIKVDERDVWIRASKVVAMCLGSED